MAFLAAFTRMNYAARLWPLLFILAGSGAGHEMHGMRHGTAMTESMLKIKQEHLWFSLIGFCIVLAKFFSDSGLWMSRIAPFLWPAFLSVPGVLLLLYRE